MTRPDQAADTPGSAGVAWRLWVFWARWQSLLNWPQFAALSLAMLLTQHLFAADPPVPPPEEDNVRRWLSELGNARSVSRDDQGVITWSSGGVALRVIDVVGDGPQAVVDTAVGGIAVPRRMLDMPGLGATVASAASRAAAAGFSGRELNLGEGVLVGPALVHSSGVLILPQSILRAASTSAVIDSGVDAALFRPRERFSDGSGGELASYDSATGVVWTLRVPGRSAYLVKAGPDLDLVVELLAGSAPLAAVSEPVAARLIHAAGTVMVSWRVGGGLSVDDPALWWSYEDQQRAAGVRLSAAPPHLRLLRPDGRLAALITARGQWRCENAAEVSVAVLARLLPDPDHMTVLGRLFTTSVDQGRTPAEIVAAAAQPTSAMTGGSAALLGPNRGQWAVGPWEQAELIQALLRQHGIAALLLAVGSRPAVAWCEVGPAGRYVARAVDAQYSESSEGATPGAALAALVTLRDGWRMPDPDAVPVRIRLPGDARLRPALAGALAFADPEPAQRMADCARWSALSVYFQQIKELRPLASVTSATGAAERRLLAVALSAVGRSASAADLLTDDEHDVRDPLRARAARVARIAILAGYDRNAAIEVANELQQQWRKDPASERPANADAAIIMAQALAEGGAGEAAMQLLIDWVSVRADRALYSAARAEIDVPAHSFLRRFQTAVVAALRAAAAAGSSTANDASAQRLASQVQQWLDTCAFRTGTLEERYADAADFYGVVLPQIRTMWASADSPTQARDHTKRALGSNLTQLNLDLPWMRASPTYWTRQLERKTVNADAANAAIYLTAPQVPPGFVPRPGIGYGAGALSAALRLQADEFNQQLAALAAVRDHEATVLAARWIGRGVRNPAWLNALPGWWIKAGLDPTALVAMSWAATRADPASGKILATACAAVTMGEPFDRECAQLAR